MLYAYRIVCLAGIVIINACTAQKHITISESIIERTKTVNEQNKKTTIQEPIPPFPYLEQEVCYQNQKAGISLAGTFTKPHVKGIFPTVLLIAGMGPNDRNATTHAGKKPFLVLADHLTRQGIAVLRVDKRGVGKSTGIFNTTVTSKDLADDVAAGVQYLKTRDDVDAEKIGLIGHSEGGMIATMVAATSHDIAYIVLMAGAMVTDIQSSIQHTALQLRADGASEEMLARDHVVRQEVFGVIARELDATVAEEKALAIIKKYWAELPAALQKESEKLLFAFTATNAEGRVALYNSPWYRFFIGYRPADVLKQITIPVLAINGELDWISAPSLIFPVMAQALNEAGNNDYTLTALPGLNHSLQTCQTGSIAEYATLEETIAPQALKLMSDWIVKRTLCVVKQ